MRIASALRLVRLVRVVRVLGLLAAASLVGATGCMFDTGHGPGDPGSDPSADDAGGTTGKGRILIAWTIGGKPASADTCGGSPTIDHLELRLDTSWGDSVTIAPIPCALDRFRYDNLPSGDLAFRLSAVDKNRCELARARGSARVSETLPADPSPVLALPSPAACRF